MEFGIRKPKITAEFLKKIDDETNQAGMKVIIQLENEVNRMRASNTIKFSQEMLDVRADIGCVVENLQQFVKVVTKENINLFLVKNHI